MKIACASSLTLAWLLTLGAQAQETSHPGAGKIAQGPDDNPVVFLWPGEAPGSEGKTIAEVPMPTAAGRKFSSLYQVHFPSLTVYLPPKEKATGAAVIVAPGGGHRVLAIDHEGFNPARWLAENGVAAFVLRNRLGRETNSTYKIEEHAYADASRAIRMVRSRAVEWNVDPKKVGIIGFSAGGELVAMTQARFDTGDPNATDPVAR